VGLPLFLFVRGERGWRKQQRSTPRRSSVFSPIRLIRAEKGCQRSRELFGSSPPVVVCVDAVDACRAAAEVASHWSRVMTPSPFRSIALKKAAARACRKDRDGTGMAVLRCDLSVMIAPPVSASIAINIVGLTMRGIDVAKLSRVRLAASHSSSVMTPSPFLPTEVEHGGRPNRERPSGTAWRNSNPRRMLS
jgi:hypothetical protein